MPQTISLSIFHCIFTSFVNKNQRHLRGHFSGSRPLCQTWSSHLTVNCSSDRCRSQNHITCRSRDLMWRPPERIPSTSWLYQEIRSMKAVNWIDDTGQPWQSPMSPTAGNTDQTLTLVIQETNGAFHPIIPKYLTEDSSKDTVKSTIKKFNFNLVYFYSANSTDIVKKYFWQYQLYLMLSTVPQSPTSLTKALIWTRLAWIVIHVVYLYSEFCIFVFHWKYNNTPLSHNSNTVQARVQWLLNHFAHLTLGLLTLCIS